MKRVKNLWPLVLIVIVVFFFFFPVFKGKIPFPGDILINTNPYKTEPYLGYQPGSYPNKAQGPDVINEIYPWRYFSIEQLKQGNIPFWNPHNFSGNPQMANFQTGIFYPFNFLYFLLPFNLSWTLIIMLQPILAGIFMYLFLKKGIGLKSFPSFIGGISFAFSSYMSVWIEYGNIGQTILWLPLILLLTKYFFEKTKASVFLGLVLAFSFAILAGYIQGFFYIYILSFFYYFYLNFGTKGSYLNYKKHCIFLISLILPFIISSFQILPTLQLFSQSTRGAYTLDQITKNLAPIFSWMTIFFPDFFGNPATRNYWIDGTYIERVMYPGTVILFFAFYVFFNKIKFLEKKFFLIIAAISLLIATNLPLVKYFYLIPIPVISTTIPTREFSIFIFSMIVLGAMGLDLFLAEKEIKKKIILIYAGFFIIVGIFLFALLKILPDFYQDFKIAQHNIILPSLLVFLIIVAVFVKNKSKNLTAILITILVVFDLFYFFNKITPFSPQELVYPKTQVISYLQGNAEINRFWGLGSAYVSSNFQSVDGTYSPEGNDPLHINYYGQLLHSSGNGEISKILPRPDANIYPAFGKDDLKNNYYRQRILNVLGVKYVLNQTALAGFDTGNFPKNIYKLVWQKLPWQIYQNEQAVSRFFMTNKYTVAKNKSQALSLIYNPKLNLADTIILEKIPNIKIYEIAESKIRLMSYHSNNVTFETDSSGNSLLFLSDNNYPDWKVAIDGKASEILTADYSFRAVAVPMGKHIVKFSYVSETFKIGLLISSLGLLTLILIIYALRKNEK